MTRENGSSVRVELRSENLVRYSRFREVQASRNVTSMKTKERVRDIQDSTRTLNQEIEGIDKTVRNLLAVSSEESLHNNGGDKQIEKPSRQIHLWYPHALSKGFWQPSFKRAPGWFGMVLLSMPTPFISLVVTELNVVHG